MALQTQTSKEFFVKIQEIVVNTKMSYMDAVLFYCESNSMEPETAGGLISGKLKQKIREEAENLNFLPKTARLPI
tara:strand:+ start:734 stop:958 length:225 start_codon:yes stop_codon:yes gene_type:complete